ncbi:MAG: MFS transporter [Bacillota bacterium]|nr:MFS transporter [Bacillota bacterium]
MNKRYLTLLTSGHFTIDIFQGALPAMLPFLIAERNLSYASAAALVFAANISSSIVQPLFGFYSDKLSMLWAMPVGLLFASVGLALAGILPSYWMIMLSVALSGIGIAAFHPEAARITNNISGDKKGTGVSTFSAGGNMGFAVGPVITTAIVLAAGLKGTLFLLIPAAAMCYIFFTQQSALGNYRQVSSAQSVGQSVTVKDEWGSFLKLLGTISCRSIIFFGFNTFLPLYWINVFGKSKAAGSTALSILIVTGAVSTLIAGRLADRFGHRKIIALGFTALIPLLFIFVHINNVTAATFMLIPIALALYAPFSPMVVYGQKYLPNHMGLASGVTLGLAVSVGGVFAPVLGWISDNYSIHAAISCLTVVPIIAAIIALFLPIPKIDLKDSGETEKLQEAAS